jgi:histidine triad (HIT) family protein
MPDDCLFCRIVAREIPAAVVRETETTLAFRDIAPKAPVHVLVIPKDHHVTLSDVASADPALAATILTEARDVAGTEGIGDGWRLIANNGAPVGQTVFHAHVHVLGGGRIEFA